MGHPVLSSKISFIFCPNKFCHEAPPPNAIGAPEPAVFLKPKGLPTRGEQLILVIENDDDDVKKPIRNPLPSTSTKRSPMIHNHHHLPTPTIEFHLPTPATLDFQVPATSKYEEIALATNVLPKRTKKAPKAPNPTFGPSNKPKRESKNFPGLPLSHPPPPTPRPVPAVPRPVPRPVPIPGPVPIQIPQSPVPYQIPPPPPSPYTTNFLSFQAPKLPEKKKKTLKFTSKIISKGGGDRESTWADLTVFEHSAKSEKKEKRNGKKKRPRPKQKQKKLKQRKKPNRKEKISSIDGNHEEEDMGLDEYKYNYAVRQEGGRPRYWNAPNNMNCKLVRSMYIYINFKCNNSAITRALSAITISGFTLTCTARGFRRVGYAMEIS